MTDYIYERGNIENPNSKDGEENHIYLAKQIEEALPGKNFKVFCDPVNCKVVMETELSGEEKTTLDNTIAYHKSL